MAPSPFSLFDVMDTEDLIAGQSMANCQNDIFWGMEQLNSLLDGHGIFHQEAGHVNNVTEQTLQEFENMFTVDDVSDELQDTPAMLLLEDGFWQSQSYNDKANVFSYFPAENQLQVKEGAAAGGGCRLNDAGWNQSTYLASIPENVHDSHCGSESFLNSILPDMIKDSDFDGLDHTRQILLGNVDGTEEGCNIGSLESDGQESWQDFLKDFLDIVPDSQAAMSLENMNLGSFPGPINSTGYNFESIGTNSNLPSNGLRSVMEGCNAISAIVGDEILPSSNLGNANNEKSFTTSPSRQDKTAKVSIPGTLTVAINSDQVLDHPSIGLQYTSAKDSGCRKRGYHATEADDKKLDGDQNWCGYGEKHELQTVVAQQPHKRHQQEHELCGIRQGFCLGVESSRSGSEKSEENVAVNVASGDNEFVGSDCTSEESGRGKGSLKSRTGLTQSPSNQCQEQLLASGKNDDLCGVTKTSSNDQGGSADDVSKREIRLLRNRASASESRRRKKSYVFELEGKCRAMESQVNQLRQLASMTAMENGALRDQLAYYQQRYKQFTPVDNSLSVMPDHPVVETTCAGARSPSDGNVADNGTDKFYKAAEVDGNSSFGGSKKKGRGRARRSRKSGVMAEPAVLESDSLPPESLLSLHPCLSLLSLFLLLLPLFRVGICHRLVFVSQTYRLLFQGRVLLQKLGHVGKPKLSWDWNGTVHYIRPPSPRFVDPWNLVSQKKLPSDKSARKHGTTTGDHVSGLICPALLINLGKTVFVDPIAGQVRLKKQLWVDTFCSTDLATAEAQRAVASAA